MATVAATRNGTDMDRLWRGGTRSTSTGPAAGGGSLAGGGTAEGAGWSASACATAFSRSLGAEWFAKKRESGLCRVS